MKSSHYNRNKHCECGKLITNKSKRCAKCWGKIHSQKMKGKKHWNFKGNKAVKKQIHYCIESECNNEIDYKNWKCGLGRCKSCAVKGERNCNFEVHRFGKDASRYRHGRTTLCHNLYVSKKHKVWRDSIFKRDKYTCQECGQIGGQLEAHHKITMASILKEYNINSMIKAYYCDSLWDIENGQTLCKDCHKSKKLQ